MRSRNGKRAEVGASVSLKAVSRKKRIIFLDVDGVLISGLLGWKTPSPESVRALNELVERTGADIVVSSCWRVGRTVVELRELLASWGVKGRVVGKTGSSKECRGYEIGQFLLDNAARFVDAAVVIIDDNEDMAGLCDRLVKITGRIGLTMKNVEQAIKILEEQE